MKWFFISWFIALFVQAAFAADIYPFVSPVEQVRFQKLTEQLRCLVCQNQSLADSNAPLASDLRNEVYREMRQGKSDKQILNYLVSRYGNYILFKPLINKATLVLWFGPFVILFGVVLFLVIYLQRRSKRGKSEC